MPPAAHVYPYKYDSGAFDRRSTTWYSIGFNGPSSNPDYADLRNSTGQGPSTALPAKKPSYFRYMFGMKN